MNISEPRGYKTEYYSDSKNTKEKLGFVAFLPTNAALLKHDN